MDGEPEKVFGWEFDTLHRLIRSCLRRAGVPERGLDDATQETLLRLCRRCRRRGGPFNTAFVAQAARWAARELARAGRRGPRREEAALEEIRGEGFVLGEGALEMLPERLRPAAAAVIIAPTREEATVALALSRSTLARRLGEIRAFLAVGTA